MRPAGDGAAPSAEAQDGAGPVPPRTHRARDVRWLAALLGLLLASRGLWIGWRPASATYWEEAYRWLAIHQVLAGETVSWLALQADHYQGGSLVMIALGVPVFALLGESALALDGVALLWSAATLVALFALARSAFGSDVARLAGAAYVAGPALVAFLGLSPIGSHGESIAWSLVQVHFYLGLLDHARSPRRFAAFGLICGLGTWFCYTAGLSALACAVTWLVLRGWPRGRELGAATIGALLGTLPWWIYNLRFDFVGLRRVAELFGVRESVDVFAPLPLPEKLLDLLGGVLPLAWLDPGADLGRGTQLALALAFAVATVPALLASLERAVGALRRPRAAPSSEAQRELVFHVYGLLWLAVYLGSRYAVEPGDVWSARLLGPLAVMGSLPLALSYARGMRAPRTRALAAAGAALWCGTLAVSSLAFSLRDAPGPVASLALGENAWGALLERKLGPALEPSLAPTRGLASEARARRARAGVGWSVTRRHEAGGTAEGLARLEAELRALPEAERRDVLDGIGGMAVATISQLAAKEERLLVLEPEEEARVARLRELLALAERLSTEASRGAERPSGATRAQSPAALAAGSPAPIRSTKLSR